MPTSPPPVRLAMEKFGLAAVVYAIIGFGYLIVNHLVEGRRMYQLWTPLDRMVPFNENVIWPYYLVFVTPLSILLFVGRIEDLRRSGLALLMNVAVAFPLFATFPVTFPRDAYVPTVSPAGLATDFIWQLDRPINCFPSIHVSLAFTAAFIVFRFNRGAGLVVLACAIAIAVSTMFVKQHYLLDIVAGIALASMSYWLVFVKDVVRAYSFFGRGDRLGSEG